MTNAPQVHRDDGFAMPSVVAAMFLITLLAATVTGLVVRDLADNSRNIGTLEARGAAEAGIDEFFSRMLTEPNYLNLTGDDGPDGHPAFANNDPSRLAQINRDGTVGECVFDGTPCYQIRVGTEEYDGNIEGQMVSYLPGTRAVSIEATAWAKCVRDDTDRCFGESRMRGTFRSRSFLEYLILADSEAVDPIPLGRPHLGDECAKPFGERPERPAGDPDAHPDGDCVSAAYQSDYSIRDELNGPIHTNDNVITVCGAPVLRYVEVNSEPSSPGDDDWWFRRPPATPACDSLGAPTADVIPGGRLNLPISPEGAGTPDYFTVPEQIAVSSGEHVVGDAVIELVDDMVIVNGDAPKPLPDGGIIYATGNVELVGGTLDGQLSIVAGGSVRITGDVTYADDNLVPGGSDDVLGINAAGSIVIEYPDGAPGESRDRRIDAAMMSVRSSVYVDRWNSADWRSPEIDLPAPPTLTINGAIAGRYRGVYGAYDDGLSDGADPLAGTLVSGFAKNFTHDRRLASTLQPPYFVAPERSAWARIDLVELPARVDYGDLALPTPTTWDDYDFELPPMPTSTTVPPTTTTTEPPGPVATAVHVADLRGSLTGSTLTVEVQITDDLGNPVDGATVTAVAEMPGGASMAYHCTTDASGRCGHTEGGIPTVVKQVTIVIEDVAGTVLPYDPSMNTSATPPSDGTTLVVARPVMFVAEMTATYVGSTGFGHRWNGTVRVIDRDGNPVEGVTVESEVFVPLFGSALQVPECVTGSDGRCTVEVLAFAQGQDRWRITNVTGGSVPYDASSNDPGEIVLP